MKEKRVCLWSGPRNISTALMYSFAERSDTRVLDEPLYGPYLMRTGADHPGREELLDVLDLEVLSCLDSFVHAPFDRPVLFVKNMAHHLEGIEDHGFLRSLKNIFLIRDPAEMLPTLIKQIPHPTLLDTAYERQHQLFLELTEEGHNPLVIDSKELLLAPQKVLSAVCDHLELPFEEAMLSWTAGGRSEDGPWAPHWYHNLHTSNGFQKYKPKTEPFPTYLNALLQDCLPFYNDLYKHALKA